MKIRKLDEARILQFPGSTVAAREFRNERVKIAEKRCIYTPGEGFSVLNKLNKTSASGTPLYFWVFVDLEGLVDYEGFSIDSHTKAATISNLNGLLDGDENNPLYCSVTCLRDGKPDYLPPQDVKDFEESMSKEDWLEIKLESVADLKKFISEKIKTPNVQQDLLQTAGALKQVDALDVEPAVTNELDSGIGEFAYVNKHNKFVFRELLVPQTPAKESIWVSVYVPGDEIAKRCQRMGSKIIPVSASLDSYMEEVCKDIDSYSKFTIKRYNKLVTNPSQETRDFIKDFTSQHNSELDAICEDCCRDGLFQKIYIYIITKANQDENDFMKNNEEFIPIRSFTPLQRS